MQRIWVIALNTFRESVRSKVLYSLFFFAVAVVVASSVFGSVTIGDQIKVVKDFGLFSIALFSTAYAVISGTSLLHKELSRKTVYNILAKPVGRHEFLFGKYFGMVATASLMTLLMGGGLSLYCSLLEGKLDLLLFQAYLYIWFELSIVCATALFFSAIVVTPLLAGLFTFAVFLSGRSAAYLLYFVNEGNAEGVAKQLLIFLNWILPNLDYLNVSDVIVYGHALPLMHTAYAVLYAFAYSGVLLVLANFIFKSREFN